MDDLCTICKKPKQGHNYIHAFSPTGGSNELRVDKRSHDEAPPDTPAPQGPVRSLMGGDPILRLLLIRRGLVTADDLAAVEDELKGAGIAVAEAMGQPGNR